MALVTNIVIQGDSIEELAKLPPDSVDLVFADPPYWMRVEGVLKRVEGTDFDGCDDEWDQFDTLTDYETFTKDWLSAVKRVLKPNGSLWVIGGMQCIYTIGGIMQQLGFWLINDVVWAKTNPTPNFKGTRLTNSHETLIWATKTEKTKPTFNYKTAKELNVDTVTPSEHDKGVRKQLGSVWRIGVAQGSERVKDDGGNKLHTTQKPEELLRRVIAIASRPGDIVLDPFGGTMTTGVVAKKMGREYIMIEKDPTYAAYGRRRLDATSALELGPVETASFDKKPTKATWADMIAAGFFTVGENLYLKGETSPAGTLADGGKILVTGTTTPTDIHSTAAQLKNAKADRLNGFDHWYVERDGTLVGIKTVREHYRTAVTSSLAEG